LGPWPQCGLFWLENAASNIEHASSFRAAAELFCWQCGGSLEKPPHLMALNRAHSCTFINSGAFLPAEIASVNLNTVNFAEGKQDLLPMVGR